MFTHAFNICIFSKTRRKNLWLRDHWRQFEQLTNAIALRPMLLLQEIPKASGSKVGRASGGLDGVDLGVSEVGQPFAISCHPSYEEKGGGWLHISFLYLYCGKSHLMVQWSVNTHTLKVYNNFLAAREHVGKVSKGKAIFCGLKLLVLLSSVVGQFDEISKHVWLHRDTAHYVISTQNLFRTGI